MTQVNNIESIITLSNNRFDQAQLSEAAISININGISHAVMMASPNSLEDFACGFVLSEGLIYSINEILDIEVHTHPLGWQINLQVLARTQHRLKQRRRNMAGPSGCGLCGLDSLNEAMNLNTTFQTNSHIDSSIPCEDIILKAKAALPLILEEANGTRGNHTAAYFDLSAKVIASREDVGRHSAFDKLLGHLYRTNKIIPEGFALITSRCSYDLIAKAARLNLATLVTLAQPTNLAVSSARKSGVALFCFQQGQLKRFA